MLQPPRELALGNQSDKLGILTCTGQPVSWGLVLQFRQRCASSDRHFSGVAELPLRVLIADVRRLLGHRALVPDSPIFGVFT